MGTTTSSRTTTSVTEGSSECISGATGLRAAGSGNIVRGNHIHDNNIAGFDPEWEAGGLKATVQTDLLVDGNVVDHNAGPGIWCDIYCSKVTISDNRVSYNTHAGIFYEVSRSGVIERNTAWANGFGKNVWGWGAGILVSSSQDTAVTGNVVAWNARTGISVISQDRTDWPDVTATGDTVQRQHDGRRHRIEPPLLGTGLERPPVWPDPREPRLGRSLLDRRERWRAVPLARSTSTRSTRSTRPPARKAGRT